jgi:hypothetical protein
MMKLDRDITCMFHYRIGHVREVNGLAIVVLTADAEVNLRQREDLLEEEKREELKCLANNSIRSQHRWMQFV